MKKFYVWGIVLLLLTKNASAQLETAVWYFGYGAGIDFKTNKPVAITDGKVNVSEGSAAMADNNGNLLFYTDGSVIWNKNHDMMKNGDGLMGGTSSTQSALIVPYPGNNNLYYVFTVSDVSTDGLRYSIVDMNDDSGLGGVTSTKNVLLYSPVTEKLSGVMNEATNEIWVMSHQWNSDNFVAYKITDNGINLTPVTSKAGSPHDCGNCNIGFMKFSPDGKKIAVALDWNGDMVEVFNFNNITGEVSDAVKLNIDNPYGLEFSSDNSKLYVSTENGTQHLYQFDLSKGLANLASNKIIIKSSRGYAGALQLAPDGKIYWARATTTSYLSVIEDPNQLGLACNLRDTAVYLQAGYSALGLPNFMQSYLGTPVVNVSGTCVSNNSIFSVSNFGDVDSIWWDFDDPDSGIENTSFDFSPTHRFTHSGKFNVKVSWTKRTSNKSKVISVDIKEALNITFSGKKAVCKGESMTLTAAGGTSYKWDNNSTDASILITPTENMTVEVTAWNENLCEARATYDIKVNNIPLPPAALNTTICFGETAEVIAIVPSLNQQVNWYVDNAKRYSVKKNSTTYKPIVGSSGEFVFYCSAVENGCESEAVPSTIKVIEKPYVSLADFKTTCVNDYSFELTEGSPAGGIYSGEGVYGERFYPTYVENGKHQITYTYTSANGCTGYASKEILISECEQSQTIAPEKEEMTIISRPNTSSIKLQCNSLLAENLRTNKSVIVIYDAIGKTIYQSAEQVIADLNEALDIPSSSSGIYILQIKVGDKIIRKKFML
jgi:hypothetical protein